MRTPHPLLIFVAGAVLASFLHESARAQVGSNFNSDNPPAVTGNISVSPGNPQFGDDADDGDAQKIFVEGPIRFAAAIHMLNPSTYQASGNMPASLGAFGFGTDGRASIRAGSYKVTTRQLVQKVLAENGQTDPRGYQLLWRGQQRNLAAPFYEKRGATVMAPVVVGIRGRIQRFSAEGTMDLHFYGAAGGIGLAEAGRFSSRPNPANFPPFLIGGHRRGFIFADGQFATSSRPPWLPPAVGSDKFFLFGLCSIRRTLRTIGVGDFGGLYAGEAYESGGMSGRFFGGDDN